jgi:serine protease Do
MKTLLLSIALATTATAALAEGELTCWYNNQGESAGADGGNWLDAPLYESVQNTRGGGGGPWVYVLGPGEWSDGTSCPESIDVSGTISEAPAGTTPNYALPPTYGSVDLAAGFMPDPYEVNLYAGGTIASDGVLAGCYAGWIAEAPDFRLNFAAGSNPRISIQVYSGEDTTLVINDPSGGWHCNDDSDGLNPNVTFTSPSSGQYDIWVGAFGGAGIFPPATLRITEY